MQVNFNNTEEFSFNTEKGILTGIAVPINKNCNDNRKISFSREALEENIGKTVPFFANHNTDASKIYGKTIFSSISAKGLNFETQLYMERNDIKNILNPIKDGIIKGVSVGVEIKKYDHSNLEKENTLQVTKCNINELSLTHNPSFEDATIRQIFEKELNEEYLKMNDKERQEFINNIQTHAELSRFLKRNTNFNDAEINLISYKIRNFSKQSAKESFELNTKLDEIKSNLDFINNRKR